MLPCVLALDISVNCGWALHDPHGKRKIQKGVWRLSGGKKEAREVKLVNLRRQLINLHDSYDLDYISYERVDFMKFLYAFASYNQLLTVVLLFAQDNGIPLLDYTVGAIKKHATDKGNANKADMLAAAKKKWPRYKFKDDNEVDAMWLLDLTLLNLH